MHDILVSLLACIEEDIIIGMCLFHHLIQKQKPVG